MTPFSRTEAATNGPAKINTPRLVYGAAVAGVVLNLITGVVNACVLNGSFQDWSAEMGSHLHPPSQPLQMGSWLLMGFLDALAGVWVYAGIRPRFGAGPITAIRAGLLVWIVGRLCVALDMAALGVFPLRFLAGQTGLGLVALLVSVLTGAWIYREPKEIS